MSNETQPQPETQHESQPETENKMFYIYKLLNAKNKCYYIGSTTMELKDRLSRHKARYNSDDYHLNEIFNENIDDVEIQVLYSAPISNCLTEDEQRININVLEEYHIKMAQIKEEINESQGLESMRVLNQKKAIRTKADVKEYYQKRYLLKQEELKQYQREYYRKNKQRCIEKAKERYRKIKEGTFKPRTPKYNYDDRKQTIYCACGGRYKKNNINLHKKTQKHQNYITTQNLVVE